jgi:threonylcarbamoyladenosine tRNA methylthiotransferase MtaB
MAKTRVTLLTFGCRVNQYESDMMRALLEPDCRFVSTAADIVLLNACTVTALAERKARQAARRARRESPGGLIVVIGCLADAVAQGLTTFSEADVLGGNAWKGRVERLLEQAMAGSRGLLPSIEPLSLAEERSGGRGGRVRAFLKIQDGCARACSYCRATQVRGAPRSKPVSAVRDEASRMVECGHPEIVLSGVDLAQYAPDGGRLDDAVRAVLSIEKLVRLRIASINPSGITRSLIDVIASDERACPHFHIPLQCGDDRVLQRMARDYTVADYLRRIDLVRDRIPGATFGTDLIVGFPGEDDVAFENTCRLVKQVGYVNVHIFRYSPRPGTAASDFADTVGEPVKQQRASMVIERWRTALRPLLDNRIGSAQDVLVETRQHGLWCGYTHDYVTVRFVSDEHLSVGSLRSVRIVDAEGERLKGIDEQRTETS